jgi:hypothetical protein
MTIAQMVKETVDGLPLSKQRKALALVRKLGASAEFRKGAKAKRKARAGDGEYVARDAAVRGIAGMWKDRTDLPKDSVQAVKAIRSRMMSRGRNG